MKKSLVLLSIMTLLFQSCMKDFLEIKRDKSQVVPTTLEDYLALLDYNLNANFPGILGEIGSDDYYVLSGRLLSLANIVHRNAYMWADDVYQGLEGEDWNRGYEKILVANFVIEGVDKIAETAQNRWLRDKVLGAAYFYRGMSFFILTQLFCEQYDRHTAIEKLGLPLRLRSNINLNQSRSSLEDTYQQIITDLDRAAQLLPNTEQINTRPSRTAARAMLANTHLQMGNFLLAAQNADMALSLYDQILDYNTLDKNATAPFPFYGQGNKEIIFYSQMIYAPVLVAGLHLVDTLLVDQYHDNDLRRALFFNRVNNDWVFKGHYSGTPAFMFCGLTVPETILVRAESNFQIGDKGDAIQDLNTLLSNRFERDFFHPISSDISDDELGTIILSERRKELLYRGRRWSDLKRLRKDTDRISPPVRLIDGIEYTLPFNSPKWVWPIPPDAINLGKLEQNKR